MKLGQRFTRNGVKYEFLGDVGRNQWRVRHFGTNAVISIAAVVPGNSNHSALGRSNGSLTIPAEIKKQRIERERERIRTEAEELSLSHPVLRQWLVDLYSARSAEDIDVMNDEDLL